MWLETTFDMKVEDEDALPEKLGSVHYITGYLQRKLHTEMALAS